MTALRPRALRGARARPTRIGYRGLDVWGMGPPSSGGSTVGETLNILEGYRDLDDPDRTRALHLFLESSRLAFADRNAYLADPDFFDVPLAGLLSDELRRRAPRADRRGAGGHEPGRARRPLRRPGRPGARQAPPRSPPAPVDHAPGGPDRHGTVVSYTFTIESTGRQRHRRARLRLPAQQRADRLQLRLAHATRTAPTATSARAAR